MNKIDSKLKEELKTTLQTYEVLRKKLFKKCIVKYVCAVLFLPVIYLVIYSILNLLHKYPFQSHCEAFWIWLVVTIVLYFKIREEEFNFTALLKKELLPKILSKIGNIKYSNKDEISLYQLKRSGLCSLNDEIFAIVDDSFCGNYNGIEYRVSEYYSALAFLFELNKEVKAKTIVWLKNFSQRTRAFRDYLFFAILWTLPPLLILFILLKYGILIEYFSEFILFALFFITLVFVLFKNANSHNLNKNREKIVLEDVVLNKILNIQSEDQIEARCLLTPAFVDKFISIKDKYKAKNIQCSFYDNKLIILLTKHKNAFECGNVWKLLLDDNIIEKVYCEITAIQELIDILRLNR